MEGSQKPRPGGAARQALTPWSTQRWLCCCTTPAPPIGASTTPSGEVWCVLTIERIRRRPRNCCDPGDIFPRTGHPRPSLLGIAAAHHGRQPASRDFSPIPPKRYSLGIRRGHELRSNRDSTTIAQRLNQHTSLKFLLFALLRRGHCRRQSLDSKGLPSETLRFLSLI